MKFFNRGELDDKKIEAALRDAADNYANGELMEVHETLLEIVDALEEWYEYECDG